MAVEELTSFELLHAAAPADWSDEIEDHDVCLVSSLDELGDATSTHFKKKLRYYRRSLESEGRLSMEVPSADSIDEFMSTLFDLHAARWKKRGLPGMLAAE